MRRRAETAPPAVVAPDRSVLLALFASGEVEVETLVQAGAAPPLKPEEASAVAHAGPARRADFAWGRAAARAALARLSCADTAIPRRADGAPIWPPGHVGSLSHSAGVCVAAVARADCFRALGLDIEKAQALEPGVAGLIVRPDERPPPGEAERLGPLWPCLLFCIKEAVYKAQHPLTGAWLDFQDVAIAWPGGTSAEEDGSAFRAVLPPTVARHVEVQGRWRRIDGWMLAGAWVEAQGSAKR